MIFFLHLQMSIFLRNPISDYDGRFIKIMEILITNFLWNIVLYYFLNIIVWAFEDWNTE